MRANANSSALVALSRAFPARTAVVGSSIRQGERQSRFSTFSAAVAAAAGRMRLAEQMCAEIIQAFSCGQALSA